MSTDMTTLILKVQERPKLEARIRDRNHYVVVPSLLLGFWQKRMFVNVEDAPSEIVL